MMLAELWASLVAILYAAVGQTVRLLALRGSYTEFPTSAGYWKAAIVAAGLLACAQLSGLGLVSSGVLVMFVILVALANTLCLRLDPRFANAFMSVAVLAQAGDMTLGAWPSLLPWRIAFDAWTMVAAIRLSWQFVPVP